MWKNSVILLCVGQASALCFFSPSPPPPPPQSRRGSRPPRRFTVELAQMPQPKTSRWPSNTDHRSATALMRLLLYHNVDADEACNCPQHYKYYRCSPLSEHAWQHGNILHDLSTAPSPQPLPMSPPRSGLSSMNTPTICKNESECLKSYLPGQILWLKKLDQLAQLGLKPLPRNDVNPESYNHPVLVISHGRLNVECLMVRNKPRPPRLAVKGPI